MHRLLTLAVVSSFVISLPLPALGRNISDFGAAKQVSRRTLMTQTRSAYEKRGLSRVRQVRALDLGAWIELKEFGVRLSYPKDWEADRSVLHEGSTALVLMLLSPTGTKSDGTRHNINLVIEDLSANPVTLNQYTDEALQRERAFFSSFTMRSRTREMVAGHSADVVRFDAVYEGTPLRYEQVWFFRGSEALVWTFTDGPDSFDANLPTFHQVLQTLDVQ